MKFFDPTSTDEFFDPTGSDPPVLSGLIKRDSVFAKQPRRRAVSSAHDGWSNVSRR